MIGLWSDKKAWWTFKISADTPIPPKWTRFIKKECFLQPPLRLYMMPFLVSHDTKWQWGLWAKSVVWLKYGSLTSPRGLSWWKTETQSIQLFLSSFPFVKEKLLAAVYFHCWLILFRPFLNFPTYNVCKLKWVSAKGTFTLKTNHLSFSNWKETQQHYNPENQRLPLNSEILWKQTDKVTWKKKIMCKKVKSYSTRLLWKAQIHGRNESMI